MESKGIEVWTVAKKRKMHQNAPQVGHVCKEQVNLAISVGDVMCAVNIDIKPLTALNKMEK